MSDETVSNESNIAPSNVAIKFNSISQIISFIKKADSKDVYKTSKMKTIKWLKKKGLSETTIIEAYNLHYKTYGLYEIEFRHRPLGFTITSGINGCDGLVSSITDERNIKLGLKIASKLHQIENKHVDGRRYEDITNTLGNYALGKNPVFIVFKNVCYFIMENMIYTELNIY